MTKRCDKRQEVVESDVFSDLAHKRRKSKYQSNKYMIHFLFMNVHEAEYVYKYTCVYEYTNN